MTMTGGEARAALHSPYSPMDSHLSFRIISSRDSSVRLCLRGMWNHWWGETEFSRQSRRFQCWRIAHNPETAKLMRGIASQAPFAAFRVNRTSYFQPNREQKVKFSISIHQNLLCGEQVLWCHFFICILYCLILLEINKLKTTAKLGLNATSIKVNAHWIPLVEGRFLAKNVAIVYKSVNKLQ